MHQQGNFACSARSRGAEAEPAAAHGDHPSPQKAGGPTAALALLPDFAGRPTRHHGGWGAEDGPALHDGSNVPAGAGAGISKGPGSAPATARSCLSQSE
jgi:hypothetical protein